MNDPGTPASHGRHGMSFVVTMHDQVIPKLIYTVANIYCPLTVESINVTRPKQIPIQLIKLSAHLWKDHWVKLEISLLYPSSLFCQGVHQQGEVMYCLQIPYRMLINLTYRFGLYSCHATWTPHIEWNFYVTYSSVELTSSFICICIFKFLWHRIYIVYMYTCTETAACSQRLFCRSTLPIWCFGTNDPWTATSRLLGFAITYRSI